MWKGPACQLDLRLTQKYLGCKLLSQVTVYFLPNYVEELWASSPRRIHLGNCTVFYVCDLRKQEIDSCYPVYNFM